MTPRRTSAGFTLLEILAALVVLGFLMAALTQGVRFGVQAWDMQTRKLAVAGDLDSIARALRRLIEQSDPGEPQQEAVFKGAAHTLSFVSRLPLAAIGGPTRDAKIGIGVDPDHRLVLRAVASPHAQLIGRPSPGLQTVLLDNVDHIDFAYWQGGARLPGWRSGWTEPELPGLVRVSIAFRPGDRRHWPSLLAAPVRIRPDQ